MVTTTTPWMPMTHADYDLLQGAAVFSADGAPVGTITAVFHPEAPAAAIQTRGGHYFLLDPGLLREWFGGFDAVYLPETAIALAAPERVDLTLTKEQVKTAGWTAEPEGFGRLRRA